MNESFLVTDVNPWINNLISELTTSGIILSPEIEAALRAVPRHHLIERYYTHSESGWSEAINDQKQLRSEHLDIIYANKPIVTRVLGGRAYSSSSQANLVVGMLAWLEVKPGLKVLEIGSGTGYNAALIAELVGDQSSVISVDLQHDIIEQTQRLLSEAGYPDIQLLVRDGFYGVVEETPFDRIIATVGCPDLSPHWVEQLAPSGFMLIPLSHGGWHPLVKVSVEDKKIVGRFVSQASFMPILGGLEMDGPWQFTHNAQLSLANAEDLPLFDGFEDELLHEDFYYFLALRDGRSVWMAQPYRYGLHDPSQGLAVINPSTKAVSVVGTHQLYDDLQRLYNEWRDANRPKRGDYQIEFRPISDDVGPLARHAWVLRRKFYWQIFSIEA